MASKKLPRYNKKTLKRFGAILEDLDPENNFDLGGIQDLGAVPDKPFDILSGVEVKNQAESDFCVATQISYTLEQDYPGFKASPRDIFVNAKILEYGGQYRGFGISIKAGMKTAQKVGAASEADVPSFQKDRDFEANPKNLPKVSERKKIESYFEVKEPWGGGRIEAMISAASQNKEPVITGIMWGTSFIVDDDGFLIPKKSARAFGHCIGIVGLSEFKGNLYPTLINSYKGWRKYNDENGRFKMRWADAAALLYRGYIGLPIKRDVAQLLLKYNGKLVKSDAPDVYLVKNHFKHHIKTENYLNGLGYTLQEIVTITQTDLDAIPAAEAIDSPDKLPANIQELFLRNNIH